MFYVLCFMFNVLYFVFLFENTRFAILGENVRGPNPVCSKFVRGCAEKNSAGNAHFTKECFRKVLRTNCFSNLLFHPHYDR